MASLMDDLTEVLEKEAAEYDRLAEYSNQLREALIVSDVDAVERLTAAQEETANTLQHLESGRARIMNDIAVVMNRQPGELRVSMLEDSLAAQPLQQQRLRNARITLKEAMDRVKRINKTNQTLLKQSMELLEFDLNLFRSMRQAPETANYNRSAENTGDLLGSRGFDAKQ